jgi:hypothetical protein
VSIVRSWREQKILLKRLFPTLSDEDFLFENENRESMFQRLQVKLNKTREELDLIFAKLQAL